MHRLGIPVRDRYGDVRAVEAYVDGERVDLYLLGRLRASFPREELRQWLRERPARPLTRDEVTWSCSSTGEVVLAVREWVSGSAVTDRSIHWLTNDPA